MLWLLQKLAPVRFLKLHMKITFPNNQGLSHFHKIYLSWKTLTWYVRRCCGWNDHMFLPWTFMECWAHSTISSIIFQKRRSLQQTPASHHSSYGLAVTLPSVFLIKFQFSYYAFFALLLQNKTLHSWSRNLFGNQSYKIIFIISTILNDLFQYEIQRMV